MTKETLIVAVLFLAGCAGTPTADKIAKFATEYCDVSPMSRSLLRGQANASLQAEAAKRGQEPAYVCFDCPGAGDECIAR